MKKIFVFNNSRITDPTPTYVALGEDGVPIARIGFTAETAPFFEYVMGITNDFPPMLVEQEGVRARITNSRAEVQLVADLVCGPGQWEIAFLKEPLGDQTFLEALRKSREWQKQRAAEQNASRAGTLAALLGILASADIPVPPPTH